MNHAPLTQFEGVLQETKAMLVMLSDRAVAALERGTPREDETAAGIVLLSETTLSRLEAAFSDLSAHFREATQTQP